MDEKAQSLPAAAASQQPCSRKPPVRRFSLKLNLHADSIDVIHGALKQIQFDLDRGATNTVSGGCDSGWSLTLIENPAMTPDRYIEELTSYLDGKRGNHDSAACWWCRNPQTETEVAHARQHGALPGVTDSEEEWQAKQATLPTV